MKARHHRKERKDDMEVKTPVRLYKLFQKFSSGAFFKGHAMQRGGIFSSPPPGGQVSSSYTFTYTGKISAPLISLSSLLIAMIVSIASSIA